jgi:biopolymer transport protein ExbB
MFEILKSGGLLMIPIVICAIIATFIVFERSFYYQTLKKRDTKLVKDIEQLAARRDFTRIIDRCTQADTPSAHVIKKAIEYRGRPDSIIHDAVDAEANLQIPILERFLSPLGTIANISTLLGLLGTVTGNIQAFGVLGSGGSMGNPAVLAGSIAQALVTTAAGLIVSIPAVIFYNFFISRVHHSVLRMEAAVTNTILNFTGGEKEDEV